MDSKIIHIDADCFYAQVEMRDDPSLRGRPVVVGGSPDSRGVVATANYEARRFGIHSAMPAARARRLCPEAVFLRPRFDAYKAESRRIQTVFRRYTPLVEPLSLDEAYLDVTGCSACRGSATLIARQIKREIRAATGLTVSAGVSYNKFLAKIASDLDKPDGLHVITPAEGHAFIADLPVGRFHGVGRATEARMHALGIRTGADLKTWSEERLCAVFGKRGTFYYHIARGIDHRPVQPQRVRKSLSSETTFPQDLRTTEAMLAALRPLAEEVIDGLQQKRLEAGTFTLKVRYGDFRLITRSISPPRPVRDADTLMPLLAELLARTEADRRPVRLLGVAATALRSPAKTTQWQMDLFDTGHA